MTTQDQYTIELSRVFEALEQPLGLIDSPERRADIERYLLAARVYVERAVFDLLADALRPVNAATKGSRARLEYDGGALRLLVEDVAEPEDEAAENSAFFAAEGDVEKVTIRLPKELKQMLDELAKRHGRSANSWYMHELGRAAMARRAREMSRHLQAAWAGGPHGPHHPHFGSPAGRHGEDYDGTD